jgi:hypothetical protein
LDHVVGSQQQRLRNRQPECLGGLEVDDELEFRGLLDWEVGWLGTLARHLGCGWASGFGGCRRGLALALALLTPAAPLSGSRRHERQWSELMWV